MPVFFSSLATGRSAGAGAVGVGLGVATGTRGRGSAAGGGVRGGSTIGLGSITRAAMGFVLEVVMLQVGQRM